MAVSGLLRVEAAWAMAAALVLALALLALRPAERASVRNALILLGACAIAVVVVELTDSMGARTVAVFAADAATILAGVVLLRLATLFVFRVALAAIRPARIVEDLVSAALYAGWILVWLRLAGVDPTGLAATSAVITAVVALSMQHTLGNILGGVVLQLDRSLRTGDWVRLDDSASGRVVDVTWRHTSIETRNGETVVVPNGWLIQNRFTVIGSRSAPRPLWRRIVRVNVDLASPPARVIAVLEASVRDAEIPHVSVEPPPSAVLLEIGARHGGYALRYWLDDPRLDDPTDSQVRLHVLAALDRNAMRLGAPYQEQLDIQDDDKHRVEQLAREHGRRIAALAAVELFAPLTAAERESLAGHLVYAPFAAGDVITREGATAHWLYLLESGTAEVWVDTPGGRKVVATLGPGSLFGEMGMMTGEPRRATVGAASDVVCYRLDKSGFESIIRARPDIAGAMSAVLARREVELAQRRGEVGAGRHEAARADIHARIRAFFGLD